jgi:hypothetical protein
MTKPLSVTNDKGSPDQKAVSAFHKKSDVDSARTAQHHTIGAGLYQVASGKHNHIDDGQSIFDPASDVLSGSLSGATATVLGQVCALLAQLGATNSTTP